METGTTAMESAFNTLKNCLKEAARAAGASLESLIEVPAEKEEIITMFPSALHKEKINNNEENTHTRSTDVFRQKCSLLRA